MHSLIEELSASDMGVFHRCFKMLRSRLRINYHENEKREFEEREERRLAAQRKRNSRRRRKQRKLAEQKKRIEEESKMDVVVEFPSGQPVVKSVTPVVENEEPEEENDDLGDDKMDVDEQQLTLAERMKISKEEMRDRRVELIEDLFLPDSPSKQFELSKKKKRRRMMNSKMGVRGLSIFTDIHNVQPGPSSAENFQKNLEHVFNIQDSPVPDKGDEFVSLGGSGTLPLLSSRSFHQCSFHRTL